MIRGTTPTHYFTKIPYSPDTIQEIWVTYLQNGAPVINKTKDDVVFRKETDGTTTVIIPLSQEDTLAFSSGLVWIQIRVIDKDGVAIASQEVKLEVERALKNGTIQ